MTECSLIKKIRVQYAILLRVGEEKRSNGIWEQVKRVAQKPSAINCLLCLKTLQLPLTQSAWMASERQCCVMMNDGDHRPCRLNVQSPCRVPDQPDEASGVIRTSGLPLASWPTQMGPEMKLENRKTLINVVICGINFWWSFHYSWETFMTLLSAFIKNARRRSQKFVQLPNSFRKSQSSYRIFLFRYFCFSDLRLNL